MDEGFSWIPFVNNAMGRLPTGVGWGTSFVVSGLAIWYEPGFGLLLVSIPAGLGLIWWMESWTAARDRAAVAIKMPTSGWGATGRFQQDREVRRRTALAPAAAAAAAAPAAAAAAAAPVAAAAATASVATPHPTSSSH